MNNFQVSQEDMRIGYGFGSIGVFTSGIVWLVSSLIVNLYSPEKVFGL